MMLGIVVSRPWIAMRMAVIALKNAADIRIKMSNRRLAKRFESFA